MLNYIEKGKNLHAFIREAGHILTQVNNVWESDDDTAVQAIIDSFDPLPDAKAEKKAELKLEGLRRANFVYSATDDVFPSIGHLKLVLDIDNTYDRSGAPAARLIELNNHLTAYEDALVVINAMTDWQLVMAYDVVDTPLWP